MPPTVLYSEAFIARFLIHSNHYPTLCTNFQSIVKSLGPYCAADEKLFEFVGNTPYIISKKGKLGLWQYELVSILGNGAPYLLHLKTWMANKARGESMSVATIVKEWLWVLNHCGDQRAITIGVADSYYFSAASITAIFDEELSQHVKFLIATTEGKYSYCDILKTHVHTKGSWKALYNPTKKMSFVHYYDPQHDRKYVLSNAFQLLSRTPQSKEVVPVSDEYGSLYGMADNFNSNLVNKTWPLWTWYQW